MSCHRVDYTTGILNFANAMAMLKSICRERYKKTCSIVENMAYVAVAVSNMFGIESTFYLSQVCTYVTVIFYRDRCKHDYQYLYHQNFIKHQTCMMYQLVVASSMHTMIA